MKVNIQEAHFIILKKGGFTLKKEQALIQAAVLCAALSTTSHHTAENHCAVDAGKKRLTSRST